MPACLRHLKREPTAAAAVGTAISCRILNFVSAACRILNFASEPGRTPENRGRGQVEPARHRGPVCSLGPTAGCGSDQGGGYGAGGQVALNPSFPGPYGLVGMMAHAILWSRRTVDDLITGHPYRDELDQMAQTIQVWSRLPVPRSMLDRVDSADANEN
jgi:hypothetical protein